MVNFGKKLMADQVEEWKGYYINYKLMKKMLKQYVQQTQHGGKDREQVLKEFSRILDDQIERIVLFLLQQQGHLASRIEELGEKRSALEEYDISQVYQLHDAYREVGLDLIKLLRFVDVNATGIRKILKKFDKRFGYKFTDYYVTTRANHPYSQLQQVFKQVGIVAVVGALSRNLEYLQHHEGSFVSIYDRPAVTLKDPIIDQVNHAVQKLTHATNFMQFLGQHSLIVQEDAQSGSEDLVDDQSYHFMSLMLNLVNTFLYMVNTYIIVPTADDYAVSLGAAATVCGIIIGSMAVAQVFSSVYFSAWSNKSYFKPLVFSSIVLSLGNLLYALAFDLNSLSVLLIGRLLCGYAIFSIHPMSLNLCFTFLPLPSFNLCWIYLLMYSYLYDLVVCQAQLLIYFMLKYAMEILLSESSVVTTYYFSWSTSSVAIFLAILGLTVLPVNAIVGSYITNLFEDRQILLASEVMVLIGIIMSFRFTPHYSIPQYVISALITFVFSEVLEGVNLSLLSRVMSSRLSRGTYNGGLLSTEAGTLARVVADATITAAGYLGTDLLLNVTLLPPLVICIVSIAATLYTYNNLY
ncbi:SPX domain-containing membrane protein [Zea mays]|nr:SPX domain-containing membrane protein [Zea mays]AQK45431.1 SPX domain-containing membrane protein [Zea mays]